MEYDKKTYIFHIDKPEEVDCIPKEMFEIPTDIEWKERESTLFNKKSYL